MVTYFGRCRARFARREEGEYRENVTDEQRREAGCLGGRYVAVIVKCSTKARGPSVSGICEGGATPAPGMPRPEDALQRRTPDTSQAGSQQMGRT
jgi:hypothetical protein